MTTLKVKKPSGLFVIDDFGIPYKFSVNIEIQGFSKVLNDISGYHQVIICR
jgi:hypothetical protein